MISEDILVVDSGSTDGTRDLAKNAGARIIETSWLGYGATKNLGNQYALNSWIVSLDADEIMDEELVGSIKKSFAKQPSQETVFRLQRRMWIGNAAIKHGSVAREYRTRIFHRQQAYWDDQQVHEELIFLQTPKLCTLSGYLNHFSYQNFEEQIKKLHQYATLKAEEMFRRKKKSGMAKRYLAPLFHFIKCYILKGGFLDGKTGLLFAWNESHYVWEKYYLLHKLNSRLK